MIEALALDLESLGNKFLSSFGMATGGLIRRIWIQDFAYLAWAIFRNYVCEGSVGSSGSKRIRFEPIRLVRVRI